MVGYYHKLFSGDETETVFYECREGLRGCVDCKKQLAKNMINYLAPIRERRRYYEERPELVKKILMEGTEKARKRAKETMKKVKSVMKIDYFENN